MKHLLFYLFVATLFATAACSDELSGVVERDTNATSQVAFSSENLSPKEMRLARFASILSQAMYNRPEVREFLKREALEQFDNNYDILYMSVKDALIGDETFREILSSYSSSDSVDQIAEAVPLLNIYLTRTALLGIYPEEFDSSDEETPVAVAMRDSTRLFLNGRYLGALAKDEVPGFHLFVLGENSRVILNEADNVGLKGLDKRGFRFKSEVFNGLDASAENGYGLKSIDALQSAIGYKAINAYKYFNKDDGSVNQKAFQRDYVYYGMTPQKRTGAINNSVCEYLVAITVSPEAYGKISDKEHQQDANGYSDKEPWLIRRSADSRKRRLSENELIDIFWAKGVYDFRFDVISSDKSQSTSVYVPVRPEQIWNFNMPEPERRHKTWFRKTKFYYSIDPKLFTAKTYVLPRSVSLGKWNLKSEALYREIIVSEEDEGETITQTYNFDTEKMRSTAFSGNYKLNLGTSESTNGSEIGVGVNGTRTQTEKIQRSVTVTHTNRSDQLGSVLVYFYDPIVEEVTNGVANPKEYSVGSVSFIITAK